MIVKCEQLIIGLGPATLLRAFHANQRPIQWLDHMDAITSMDEHWASILRPLAPFSTSQEVGNEWNEWNEWTEWHDRFRSLNFSNSTIATIARYNNSGPWFPLKKKEEKYRKLELKTESLPSRMFTDDR